MPATMTALLRDSLHGQPKEPLKLRLLQGGRAGQVLKLHSPKVAIGSSSHCTLRIRAVGVLPVHCLIVRGSDHTIIRRVSGDTRLNDAAFDDAVLQTGDRLGIGPLEFEVFDDQTGHEVIEKTNAVGQSSAGPIDAGESGEFPADSEAVSAPASTAQSIQNDGQLQTQHAAMRRQSHRQVRQLVHQLRLVRNRVRELEQLDAVRREETGKLDHRWLQLESDIQSFVDERQRWQEVRTQNERLLVWRREQLEEQVRLASTERESVLKERADLAAQHRELARQMAELEQRQSNLDEAQRQFQEQEQKERQLRDQQARESAAHAASLAEREPRLAAAEPDSQDRSTHESEELQTLRAQLESTSRQLELGKQELDAIAGQRAEFEACHAEFQTQTSQLKQHKADLEKIEADLAKRKADFDARTAELDKRQQALSEVESRQAEFLRQQEKLAADQQALALQRQTVESQLTALESEEQQRRKALADQDAQLRQAADALEKTKAQFANDQAQWSARCQEQEAALANRQEELNRQAEEIERQRDELERLRDQHAEIKSAVGSSGDDAEAGIQVSPTTKPNEQPSANTNTAQPQENFDESAESVTDEDEVFARLRALSLLKEEPTADRSDEVAPPQSVDKRNAEPASEKPAKAADDSAAPAAEESIDDYMSRLLQRMRNIAGEGAAASAKAQRAPSARTQSPSATEAAAPSGEVAAVAKKLLKLEPRKVAPEKIEGLAAMREIANLSARSAIATHHHRRGASRAISDTFVGLVGLGCGTWLLIQCPDTRSPFFYGGLMGLVVSLYWFAKARLVARSVRAVKRHHQQQFAAISRQQTPPAAESEATATNEAENPAVTAH